MMKRWFMVGSVFAGCLASSFMIAGSASAESIGTYSTCKKKLSGASLDACMKCVGSGGGNFYQTTSKTCGMSADMKPSKPSTPKDPPPPKPATMPSTGTQYVTIPAGTFRIGMLPNEEGNSMKEEFESTVTITRPFMMKTTEVTHGEWQFITGEVSLSYDKKCGQTCPVGNVGWKRALEYLNMLSKRENLESCYVIEEKQITWTKGVACTGYRLPTEAEWEYAARGKTTTARYGEVDKVGWAQSNSDGAAHPVGQKAANAYGLFDMLGNVWEWTWEIEDPNAVYKGNMRDPILGGTTLSVNEGSRMVRGASYRSHPMDLRATHRYQYPASSDGTDYGFRPVRTVSAAAK